MMEKSYYEKKIVPYLDGSLSQEELAEFEAFVLTHPEIEQKIKSKQEEIELIRRMIPSVLVSAETKESLENEFRASSFNLLREEPRGFWDQIWNKWEDWINR
jgi:anti-sigma factor RsiW